MKKEIYEAITQKKEFSQLPKKDVEIAYSHFERRQTTEEEKIRLTRNLLREVFSAFTSKKLLSGKKNEPEWVLRKHLSTRERLEFYSELYRRILKGFGKKISIIDLGAGVNGFSYKFFKEAGFEADYFGVESIGQLAKLTGNYFEKERINGRMFHSSLFDIEEVKKIIKKTEKPRVVFLFKVIDSLEMLERDFSKKLISGIAPLADRVIVSFATESLIKRKRFYAKRTWFLEFIEKNYSLTDNFELGKERYIVFEK
jgi:hypothetical protein